MSTQQATFLPSEILFRIFKDTDEATLIQLQTVCRSWYFPARQVFFHTIHVKHEFSMSKLISGLQSAGSLVKSLKVDLHKDLRKHDLISLVSACPEVYDLQVYNDPTYFQWLLEENVDLPCLKYLQWMGRVSWRSNETNAWYYRAVYKYRLHLERLDILLACSSVFENEFGGIMNYLASFEILKQLNIMDGSRNVLIYFDQLLNNCRGLQKLKIDLGHPLLDPNLEPCYAPYRSMRHIELFMAKFSMDYFEYMMRRFVNLDMLHVRINQSRTDWEDEKKEIVLFMKNVYLPYIRKLSHSSLSIHMQDASCIGESFADFTQVNKDTLIDSLFEVHAGRHQRTVINLETKGNNTLAHYTFVRDFSSEAIELPFLKHLMTYGKSIKTLAIHITNSTIQSIDLGLILDLCPNTSTLCLAQLFPRDCSWSDMIFKSTPTICMNEESNTSLSLLNLKLDGAMISPSLLASMATHIPNLQDLSLINCTFLMDTQTTHFDMSNLDLKTFSLDAKWFYHGSQQHTCFVMSSQGSKAYYILDTEADTFNQVPATNKVDIEFNLGSVDTFKVHIGKFSKRQRIQTMILK